MEPRQFWAKLRKSDPAAWHPLIAHSADVAAVGARLLEPDSFIGRRLAHLLGSSRLDDALRRLLILLIGIHDLGKVNHGFQGGRRSANGPPPRREGHVRVVLQSWAHPPLRDAVLGIFKPIVPDDSGLPPLLLASIAHHGRPHIPEQGRGGMSQLWGDDPASGRNPIAELSRVAGCVRRWSGVEAHGPVVDIPTDPGFTHLFAGLVTLADWIGSTEPPFDFAPWADDDPDRYWEKEAQPKADFACREIGVVASRTVVPLQGLSLHQALFPKVFGSGAGNHPNELQSLSASFVLPTPGSRILVEAPTGSGKTEAALALYARMRAEEQVGGLMFALPTRATARAMRSRVADALHGMYGSEAPGVTLAVGGDAAQIESADAIMGGTEHLVEDDERQDRGELATWASSHAKKFLSAEIVVGTVDQALLAALAVKHANLRLAGLSRHLLVVDEVHSHDRYMLQTLRTLLDFHSAAGGQTLLMSATLSREGRDQLGGEDSEQADFETDIRRPYPTVVVLEPRSEWKDQPVDTGGKPREIAWRLVRQQQIIEAATKAARSGARVCILRNLVKDAQRTCAEISATEDSGFLWRPPSSPYAPPYHAKYAKADRNLLDQAVLDRFGKDGPAEGGCILVATQVIEQSLDVDFDFLVTDLAPVEVLLQRIGRLHRHPARSDRGLRPPGYESSQLHVIGPEEPFVPAREFRGPHGWGTVYREQPILELTRRLIEAHPTIALPHETRRIMESVYHWSRWEELRDEDGWTVPLDEMDGAGLSETFLASDCVLVFEKCYHDNAPRYRDEAKIRTRIGDDTVRVTLDPPVECIYAKGAVDPHVARRRNELTRSKIDLADPIIGPGRKRDDGVMEYPYGKGILRYGPIGWAHDAGAEGG